MRKRKISWRITAHFDNGAPSAITSDCGRYVIERRYEDGCSMYALKNGGEESAWSEDLGILKAMAEARANA